MGATEATFRHPAAPALQLTTVVRAPPLDAHVELVAHSHIHSQCHAGLLHILGVSDPQLTERCWGNLGTCMRQCCLPNSPCRRACCLPALPRGFCGVPVPSKLNTSSRVRVVDVATPSPGGPPHAGLGDTYKAVAGAEGAVRHHAKAG